MAKRVACVLSEGFEDSEFRHPYDALRGAGFAVDVIGAKAGESLAGKAGKERVKADRGIDDAEPGDYDALFIPGGYSPDHLRADPRFVDFTRAMDAAGKPVLAVCHGPQLLMAADLVQRGRRLTAWKTIQKDLQLIGANVQDAPVVVDGNWVTSRQPEDLPQFSAAAVRAVREAGAAAEEAAPAVH